MSELREQMEEVKAPDAAQVIAQATGGARRRQVKVVLFGSLIAVAVFMTLAAKLMRHPRRSEPASLGMASPGAAPIPAPTRPTLLAGLPGQPETPTAQPVGALEAPGATPTLPAPAALPEAAQAAPGASGGVAVAATPVPSANQAAPSATSAQGPAEQAAITRRATLPAQQGAVGRPAAAPKAEADALAATGPQAHPTAPSVHLVAKRRGSLRAKGPRRESPYDRIGISEE